jgi:hypothetical protein
VVVTRQATLSIVVKIIDKIFRSVSSGISQKLLTTALGPILVPLPLPPICHDPGIPAVLRTHLTDRQLQFANPAFFLNPVTLTYTNLHPVSRYGLNFVSYISFVLAWIGKQANGYTLSFRTFSS